MILEGEIKDAKMSSFSSDFQTRIKHSFPLYFHHELLMSLRSNISNMRCSVSPDETPRRELKIRRAAEYFLNELLMTLRSLKAKVAIASSVPKKMKTLFLIFPWSYSALESRQRQHSN